MTAQELDKMVKAMRTSRNTIDSRCDLESSISYLINGLRAIRRKDLAEALEKLYEEIDEIDTQDVMRIGTFG